MQEEEEPKDEDDEQYFADKDSGDEIEDAEYYDEEPDEP